MEVILGSVMVFLLASVVIVPIAKRLRLGSVLGYLLAGLAIGPWGLSIKQTLLELHGVHDDQEKLLSMVATARSDLERLIQAEAASSVVAPAQDAR